MFNISYVFHGLVKGIKAFLVMPAMSVYTTNNEPWRDSVCVQCCNHLSFRQGFSVVAGFFITLDQGSSQVDVAGIEFDAAAQNVSRLFECTNRGCQVSE